MKNDLPILEDMEWSLTIKRKVLRIIILLSQYINVPKF